MRRYGKKFWRSIPFLRLLIPLTAGIVLARYLAIPIQITSVSASASLLVFIVYRFLPSSIKYPLRWLNGLSLNILFISLGTLLIYFQNIEHRPNWIGHFVQGRSTISLVLEEPLTEKNHSYKAIAKANAILINNRWQPVTGRLLLYFRKDSMPPGLDYGSQLVISQIPQPITNSGNPGGFDYKVYCAMQDIHFQVYLNNNDYIKQDTKNINRLTAFLFITREKVLHIFRKWVPGQKEAGVAEALLIGYRDDLDKELLQSYSNTGVVHIIAISGLHLGMIYGLMVLLLKPFRKLKWIRWIKPLLILLVLWGFSLLAGAAASILRSAVMFSFIVIGESMGRKTNIFNSLAASAFCLLLYQPFFLWDVGFQLSYAAVVSITLLMKPIYRQFYFDNKLLKTVWQLNAVTLSAQVLTLPVLLYYFHQFPNLFLFTNFIAVPLSGFILYGELVLLLVSGVPWLNMYAGKAVSGMIYLMNSVIENTGRLPFAVSNNISFSLLQTILLYFTIGYLCWWLFSKKGQPLIIALSFLAVCLTLRSFTLAERQQQHKLIVYNIPHHSAIDIIEGSRFRFMGDPQLNGNNLPALSNLRPSRMYFGVSETDSLSHTLFSGKLVAGSHTSVLIINRPFHLPVIKQKIPVDIIILSGNPGVYLSQLAGTFKCKQYVFDSSNPLWKIRYWKKDADSLHLRHHSTSEQGAFEVDL